MSVKELTEKDFNKFIENETALIEFYAEWCPSCRVLNLIVNEIAKDRQDISFGKINVGTEAVLSSKFNIKSIPTLVLFREGKEAGRSVGVKSKMEILDLLD